MTQTVEKYVTPHQLPEGLDRELLTILAEECAEVIKAVSKSLRFGLDNGYPDSNATNRDDIEQEVGDIMAVVERLVDRGVLSVASIERCAEAKSVKLARYLQSEPS